MPLPYPTKVVLPFDIATAQDMNERHANDVALANGTGIGDNAITPEKRVGGFKTINHSFTSTTGTKTITGVGFAPKAITVFSRRSHQSAAVPGIGQASFDGSTITQGAQASVVATSGNRTIQSTSAAFVSAQSGTDNSLYRGIVTSFDADGITVNITADDQAAREWTINFYG